MLTKILIFIFSMMTLCFSIRWLALYRHHNLLWNITTTCYKMSDILTNQQINTCLKMSDVMPYLVRTSIDTLLICQYLFANSRWNCSSLNFAPHFNPDLKEGTKERAIVHSLSSSALMINIARGCSSGHILQCHCRSRSSQRSFKWTGCGDDIVYARGFAELFLSSAAATDGTFESEVDNHNYAVGRKIARKSLRNVCKCHGTSGSCNFRTCWKVIDDLRVIGDRLLERFLTAVEVKFRRTSDGSFRMATKKSEHKKSKKVKSIDLVFRSISSDYCQPDLGLGSIGTKGRQCQKDAMGAGRCDTMCCGRGFKTEERTEDLKCRCKYYWCCYVKCDVCQQVLKINTCR